LEERLPLGKLPSALLERLLARYAMSDERLIIGPGIGRDAAAIAIDGQRAMVVKTDPITFATAEIGWYLVNVNANDLACLGATPRWLLVTALLPEGRTTPTLVEEIFAGLHAACTALGITLVGGHTEITHGLDRPILVGALLGEAPRAELVEPGRAQVGDKIILTKGLAVEGTALIAGERAAEVSARHGEAFAARCQDFLHHPGISVVRDAVIARAAGAIGLHDPTEGGVATGLRELAQAAGLGLAIDAPALPIYPETAQLCADYDLDPLGLIASGSLLIVAPPDAAPQIIAELAKAGIVGTIVGIFTAPEEGLLLCHPSGAMPLPEFAADEIARLYAASLRDDVVTADETSPTK
jgi:hydrogenase expression/formation protein HypE